MSTFPPPERELDSAAFHWQWALDAEGRALEAAGPLLTPSTVVEERHALARERRDVAFLLSRVARARAIEPPWLPSGQVTRHMLALPPTTAACIFDLDGVLTDSGVLHATAWAETLDPLLLDLAHSSGRAFVPFDTGVDYHAYFDGRSRLDGIHLFLTSRGLQLPEGDPTDTAAARTILGIARRKGEALEHVLHHRGITAFAGARRYLQAAGYARLPRGVVSASASTLPMLRIAALEHLVDVRADAETMRREGLHPRPAPDLLLAVCRALDVDPRDAVSFTHSGAGVVAANRLGMHAIGVAQEPRASELRAFGAATVVPSLASLLEPPLRPVRQARERRHLWS